MFCHCCSPCSKFTPGAAPENIHGHKSDKPPPPEHMPKKGDIYMANWKILRLIGQGGYGCVFKAVNLQDSSKNAIKIEKLNIHKRMSIETEVEILLALKGKSSHVCDIIASGIDTAGSSYMVITLLDRSLKVLRKKIPKKQFSLSTAVRCGEQILQCLEDIHSAGYLYRDIKPSNFMIGFPPKGQRRVHVLDFGLARRFRSESGRIFPARPTAGFCGTFKYASLNCMLLQEQGRRDDLQSLFFLLLDFCGTPLPWRKIHDPRIVLHLKQTTPVENLTKNLSQTLRIFSDYVVSLRFEEEPDYVYIRALFDAMMMEYDVTNDEPFDWEVQVQDIGANENPN